MRADTKSQLRITKARKFFRDYFKAYDKKQVGQTTVEFVNMIGEEEAQFKVSDDEKSVWILFYGNDIMSCADWEIEELGGKKK